MKRWPLVASFVLFIVLCASVAYWAMQLFTPPLRAVAAPPQSAQAAPNLDAAAGLFGGRSNVAVASNFQLKGVVMSGNSADSVAILATDGKPAQAVRVNTEVVPGVTVKEVHRQYVLLSDGGIVKRVELPEEATIDGNVAVSSRSPVPARTAPTTQPAPNTQAAPNAPTAPPRVVVSPPPSAQTVPSRTGEPSSSTAVAPAASPQTGEPGGAAGMPADTAAVPAADTGGGASMGYNPAGAQAVPPPQAPSAPQSQAIPQTQPAPGTQ